ncbi:MAG: HAD-IB family phosphatase [Candidatus Aegiribacteria sp.]|nr:HAD-IB family phosphatase [Candidatus Aegiribacteria sp.]
MDIVRLTDGAVPGIYFVDLDGTLLSTSSEKYFLKHLVNQSILSPAAFLRFLTFYVLHPGKTIREGKGWNRNYLTGIPPEAVKREAVNCAGILMKNYFREWTLRSVNELKNAGCETILLSASLEYIVASIAESIPMDYVQASNPAIENGRFTGLLNDLRPWGKNKAELMRRICRERGVKPENCVAAGDSWADRFIMSECGCSVAVCPDRKLRKLAVSRKWRIVEGRHTKWA